MNKRTIGMVLPVLITKNGTAKQCIELSLSLKKRGHDVRIFTFAYSPSTADQKFSEIQVSALIQVPDWIIRTGVNIFTLEKYLLYFSLLAAPVFRLFLQRQKNNVLHSHDWLSMWFVAPLKNEAVRLVATINDVPQRETGNQIDTWKLNHDRSFGIAIDAFTVLDISNKQRLQQWLPGTGARIHVVRSGIHAERYRSFGHRLTIKNECSVPDNALVLACANILSAHRRYENVIEAVAVLRKKSVDVHLVILSKRDANLTYAHTLDKMIRQYGVADSVHFIDRFFTDEERMAYIQSSDILVFPNYPQTWGLTVLEAMALGVPTIVSRGSGVSEILHDKKDSLLYDAGNVKQLITAIEYLRNNPDQRKQIAREGKKYVLSTYTWDTYAKQMETVYS